MTSALLARRSPALVLALALSTGCASTAYEPRDWSGYTGPGAAYFQAEEVPFPHVADPLEPINRVTAKANYELFAARCAKCHSLARPINSDYALDEEWSRYVKRMMRKPGSGISPKEAKKIYEFLAYDSSVRKKDLIESKKAEMEKSH